MRLLEMPMVGLILLSICQVAFAQRLAPSEPRYEPVRREVPPHIQGSDTGALSNIREDVPKWVPIVIIVVLAASIGAVAIAFKEVESKVIWAIGSILFLGTVVGLLYLVIFILLGVPHN